MAKAVLDALVFILLSVAWAAPLMLVHELGHALAALAVTDGEVRIGMRSTPSGLMVGECTYEPAGLRHPRAEALIAAAGPLVSLLSALVLAFGSLKSGAGTPDAPAVATATDGPSGGSSPGPRLAGSAARSADSVGPSARSGPRWWRRCW